MRIGRMSILLSVAAALFVATPLTASAALTNDYGMTFAGENTPVTGCTECHSVEYGRTVHGRFAKAGLTPPVPANWTVFKAAGDVAPVAGTKGANFNAGGSYDIAAPWLTLGDIEGGAATEYLTWKGSTVTTVSPWLLVEGLSAEPDGVYSIAAEDPAKGLYDVVYGCQRCHQLGTTMNTSDPAAASAVPNPAVSIAATYTTAAQWARDESKSVADFMNDPTVSELGMSIQCEACHGTGLATDKSSAIKHFNSGTAISHKIAAGTQGPSGAVPETTISTLGQSQVCGQCHGSYTNVAGTLGIYGYTPNLPLRTFVNINGTSGTSASYTYTPTEAEFLANPTKYYLFPNGSNAKGSHFYYNEWSTSGHAVRGHYTAGSSSTGYYSTDPDGLVGQGVGVSASNPHYNAKTSGLDCARCHTGEGYLNSKGAPMWADMSITTSTVGYMGQECVTCHNAHPATNSDKTSATIRSGDAAGVRSNASNASIAAAGLPANTTANASVCEDCHNWQLEVQGGTPTIKPQASLASRGGPSHPQRETLHGRSLLEVPAAGEFMPGAKCQDCHMPKTNKAANRFSHGMHIMLPGKAKEWNAAAGSSYLGEDSCSNCHAGETRDSLQANIDKWQGDVTAASDVASAAISAAVARNNAEFSLTDSTKPGYILAGRATWNFKAVGSDGSGGAHNPEYILDGLSVATKMAKSVGGSIMPYASASVRVNTMAYVAGNLSNGDGSKAAGAKVALLHNVGGVWTEEQSASSDVNGNVSFMVEVPVVGNQQYRLRWDRSSIDSTDLYGAVTTTAVTKYSSKTTLVRSASTIYYGRYVKLSGVVTPAASGAVVSIQAKKGTGSWKSLTTATLSSTSKYAKSIKPSARGTWYYRVKYAGNATVAASTSVTVKVVVK